MMRKLGLAFLFFLLLGSIVAFYGYSIIFKPNVDFGHSEDITLLLPSGSSYSDLLDSLETKQILKDVKGFQWVSSLMNFSSVRPGMYALKPGMSNKELVSMLRSGRQQPVKLTFNNVRTIEDLGGVFASQLELDSVRFINHLNEQLIDSLGYTKENILSLFIPNTYEVFWNTSIDKFVSRMQREHGKFWNKDRRKKLEELGLTTAEAYTLASIVQKETLVNSEKPTVAGVYLNRLRRGQLLQADPTVVFANGDFTIRRVLNKHLRMDSPYNTYMYEGLPPGPICMPDISSIDAVLNYEKHRYLYFCASTDNSGRHVFASTLVEHNRNANRYRAYLNKEKIYR